jgi:hypothetical protein
MSWIRQAAEYIVRVLSGTRTAPPDYDAIGKDLHGKLIKKHGTQFNKSIGAAKPGEYPRRRSGTLQNSLQTTIYKQGEEYLVSQRVNLDLLFAKQADQFNYPNKLYKRGYLGPNNNLSEEGLNVTDWDNFNVPSGDIQIYFDKSGA